MTWCDQTTIHPQLIKERYNLKIKILLTTGILIGILVAAALTASAVGAHNYPQPTQTPFVVTATPTTTPTDTATPAPSQTPTATSTSTATATPTVTDTPWPKVTDTPVPTQTPVIVVVEKTVIVERISPPDTGSGGCLTGVCQ